MKNKQTAKKQSRKRNEQRVGRSAERHDRVLAELELDPSHYDESGLPIMREDPQTGAWVGGDPAAFDLDDVVQVVGTPQQFASGVEPKMRPMRIEDLDDDCPICEKNRARIEAGNPPMVLAFD